MKVNFYATLRQSTGQKTVEFDLSPGLTATDLLQAVLQRFPQMEPDLVDETGKLHSHIHLFINGRDSQFLEDEMQTKINAADKIDIFPPVGGGSPYGH